MAAPIGNQFWKNIDPSKIGRKRNFKSPKELWDKALEYFKECDDNPLEKIETITATGGSMKDAEGVSHASSDRITTKVIQHKVPYTWEGLYIFLEVCNLDYYKEDKVFSGILGHIGNVIRNQKYSGAVTGIFKENIIARDLNIKEQTENINTEKVIVSFK